MFGVAAAFVQRQGQMKVLLCAVEALSFLLSVFHRVSFFFLLSYPVFPGSIHILSAPGIFYGKKMSAELQVGAFLHILFKSSASRPIGSCPLGSSPDKLCGLVRSCRFFVCVQHGDELTLDCVVALRSMREL